MDSLTHIYFAQKLLVVTGGKVEAAICSLFPQIDREPAYFHRMYGHPLFQVKNLAEVGSYVYKNGDIRQGCESSYEWRRFRDELPRMKSFARLFEEQTGISISSYDADLPSVILGFVSHIYQDIFNNPLQAFLPRFVYPCGKWELWTELDSVNFRTVLYNPENIDAFRTEFFGNPLWNTRLDGPALLRAMVNRTAAASAAPIPSQVIEAAFDSVATDRRPDLGEVREAEAFLLEHEQLLAKMIHKYSEVKLPSTDKSGLVKS